MLDTKVWPVVVTAAWLSRVLPDDRRRQAFWDSCFLFSLIWADIVSLTPAGQQSIFKRESMETVARGRWQRSFPCKAIIPRCLRPSYNSSVIY